MKAIVKLAVLFATLLLITGVAFAQEDCECYKITLTSLDNPPNTENAYEEICLDYENNTGAFETCNSALFPGLITQGLVYDPTCCKGYFKFHGNDNNVVTGEFICMGTGRYTFWGHITDRTNCTCLDGIKDRSETDVDCGGLICVKCAIGKSCKSDSDCLSGFCNSGTCDFAG